MQCLQHCFVSVPAFVCVDAAPLLFQYELYCCIGVGHDHARMLISFGELWQSVRLKSPLY